MTEQRKQSQQQNDSDLLDGLEALGRALDGVEYPGRAWPVRSRRRRVVYRLVGIASVTATVAAILLFALILRETHDTPKVAQERRIVSTPPAQTTTPSIRTEEPLFRINIPTDIDPSLAGQVNLVLPATSWPPITDISPHISVDWQLPTLSALWIE